ncbi:hypothetical protein AAG570_000792 [Ranatra chinensis]|uniref:Inositol polyphosphate 1-phosphatase n=1 Tax=Ranatra chinensis TaxID=642074 RepID=A0ABD0ZLD4_9HEMI
MGTNIIDALILVSEKAANIARICREDSHLLSLLVQEKKEDEKNPRFAHDFKTFADVLVQEVVKYELGAKFPSLCGFIYGEESNEFVCGRETVFVEVKQTLKETEDLLLTVLGDPKAVSLLAEEVHRNITTSVNQTQHVSLPENLGIWIDPIDATAEYIRGGAEEIHKNIHSGLPTVTVLIGVFNRDTGEPVVGVINQPFHSKIDDKWNGRHIYGILIGEYQAVGPGCYPECIDKVVAVSSSEDENLKNDLKENGYTIVEPPGAGYKLMSIIDGHLCAYILTKPSTFLWDLCACHAILKAMGGDVLNFHTLKPIRYNRIEQTVMGYCNEGGILAFRNPAIRDELVGILRNSE